MEEGSSFENHEGFTWQVRTVLRQLAHAHFLIFFYHSGNRRTFSHVTSALFYSLPPLGPPIPRSPYVTL
ncbi:hypothetical protein NC651_023893 [Populus alba x Populus x berolinensis]|nr:hypothetical protein NC651_023893 [Populus alba x Populus x berolinensis]